MQLEFQNVILVHIFFGIQKQEQQSSCQRGDFKVGGGFDILVKQRKLSQNLNSCALLTILIFVAAPFIVSRSLSFEISH